MTTIIAFILAGILILGLMLLVAPAMLLDTLNAYARTNGIRALAIVMRVILGIAFIVVAPDTQYPTLIYLIGAIAIVAAIVIALMPKDSFADLLTWASQLPNLAARFSGVAVLVIVWLLALIVL